ncbi:MAG: hypothetical protein IPG43_24765 [Proteobacteria bacterium]|nr:hypothetical protein [Pseudomonadota bacterium]
MNLDEVWADHPLAYLSIAVPGFPNFFMLNGPNGPVGNFSLIQIAESQVSYVLQLVGQIRAGACREIGVRADATADFEIARGSCEEIHLGHRPQELVSRSQRRAGELAVDAVTLLRGNGLAAPRGLRAGGLKAAIAQVTERPAKSPFSRHASHMRKNAVDGK